MKPAIATVCSLEASLGTVLDDYAAGHVDAVDLWLGHADAFIGEHAGGPVILPVRRRSLSLVPNA